MLRADPTHQDAQAEVHLQAISPAPAALDEATHFTMHSGRDDCGSKNIDELLLDARQLCQVVISLRGKKHKGQSSQVERARDHLLLAVGEDVGRRRRCNASLIACKRGLRSIRSKSLPRSSPKRSLSPSMRAQMSGFHINASSSLMRKNFWSLKASATWKRHALVADGSLVISKSSRRIVESTLGVS